ncbi:MAG: PKD domain-containing protein, partial [Nanoarchaeota archaeon]|nr:PKD domain-containing protein [Nanoarchaeota archaeon]
SENRSIFLNNSAPNITQTSPATEINISEPNNQTFSINYTNDNPSLLIEWYLNSTLIANETNEWNFTGNYSSTGSYNITVIINDSILSDNHSWILNISDTPTLSILSKYPDNDSVVIDEPETALFNISLTDLIGDKIIIWYLNNTAQQAYENSTNYSFGGNYSCEGNYTIRVEINNSYDSVFEMWNLTVLNNILDLTPPDLTIESPENGTILTADSVLINVSSNETLYNSTLHIVNTSQNISMEGSDQNWHYNLSGDEFITFFISANDSAGNTGYTENITIFLNNSAPNITNTTPADVVNISEPSNQTFTINYTDNGPYTSVKWYFNSNLVANETTEWNFTGNYSSAGSYNITVTINDSVLQNEHSWVLNVNDTNKPLYWLHSFINLTLDEDSSITYDVNATDDESDTITYSLNTTNTTEISIDNDTGLINFTPAQDWYGLLPITVTASDGVNNITGEIVFNVTPLNDAPQFTLTYNETYNESETINITVNATDIDNDNLTYGINDTRFTLINDSFIWNTTYQDSGSYYFKVNVSDGNQVTETIINITILEVEDVDNDGINDSADYLEGDAETIISNISLNISIGNLTNLSQEFNGTHEINISYNASSLLEFNWTFNNTTMLNLSAITIEKQPTGSSSGYLLVKGLNLTSQASTKTIYVAKLNTSIPSICIKDAEIDSINNISSLCNE